MCFSAALQGREKYYKVKLTGRSERQRTLQFSFVAALYIFQPTCLCAVVVKGPAADLAVMYCARGLLKFPDACCSVCALAIGTGTHSDRHLPSSSNPFYTSSPDDKRYFPFRHSEKELGGKQLIVPVGGSLLPISPFPTQNVWCI